MTTEPVSIPDELPTAQKLAQHPRWEWRAGMQAVETRYETPHTFRLGRHVKCYSHSDTRAPDLADDATAGIVLGMVRAWGEANDHPRVDLCICRHPDSGPDPTASVSVGHWRGTGPYIEGTGPTLGDAAAACLLACWARDAQGAGR